MDMNRTFGVEIEFFNCTRTQVETLVNRKGLTAEVQDYNHIDSSYKWKLVTDSSVNPKETYNYNGAGNEIVSPVLEGEEGFEQLKKVCEALKEADARVDTTCGLHIHLGAEDLTVKDWKNVILMYARYQECINSVLAPSRHKNSMTAKFATFQLNRIKAATTLEQMINAIHEDRYRVINLTAFLRHGTIEFRQHGGTIEYEKISNWIKLMMALVAEAKRSREVKVKEDANTSTAWMNFMDALQYNVHMDKDVRKFFAGRRKHFANKSKVRVA